MTTLEPPRLETERLVLTLPPSEDAPRLLSFLENDRAHFAPWDPPYPEGFHTLGFWEKRLPLRRAEYASGTSACFVAAMRDDPDGPVVAMASLTGVMRGPLQSCYLGYRMGSRHQGRGLMREACEAVIAHAFGPMQLRRVQANYVPVNERSANLLRRLGFVVEGYARDYLYIDGRFRDHVLTSKTNPDWPAERAPSASSRRDGVG